MRKPNGQVRPVNFQLFVAPGRANVVRPALSRLRIWLGVLLTALALSFVSQLQASTNLSLARQLNQAFVEVAERVTPSVVVITVRQTSPRYSQVNTNSGPRWFQEMEEVPLGHGSGVIIREDGYIVTNQHVVQDAESIEVRLQDGRRFRATVRGSDPQSEIAVIKIEATGLPAARFADSATTRVGEFAIAIGAPFNLDYSVTFGHVSAKGRSNIVPTYAGGAIMDQDFIQTDANINPGNSGGPLVNIEGEVIGINTMIRGLRTGIGFAVPSNLTREVAEKLIADGRFTRAWLGVSIRSLRDDADYRALLKNVQDGVIVNAILPEVPAADSELRASDIITAVDGEPVGNVQDLRNAIRGKTPGRSVSLEVYRNDSKMQVTVKPAEWKDTAAPEDDAARTRPAPAARAPADIGVRVQALTPELARKFRVNATRGVLVTAVEQDSPAAKRGIAPGDVITAINHEPTETPRQFRNALRSADLAAGVIVNLTTQNTSRFEILKSATE